MEKFLNTCGLKTRCQYPEFIHVLNDCDLFCVSETKLDPFDVISIPNFTFFSKPRKQKTARKSGGIGIFVKNNLLGHVINLNTDCEYVSWLKVCKSYTHIDDIIIGVLYIPPIQSPFYNDDQMMQLELEITKICSSYSSRDTYQ